jgi:heptosyltransferase I
MTQEKTKKNFLLVRLDRIGDLVLSLPVDESLSRLGFEPDWWIPTGLQFVTKNALPKRRSIEIPKDFQFKKFFELLRILRQKTYSGAIVFHAPWWVGALLFLAGVPVRIGVKSQWHSFLFFNRGVRQKRSRAEFSELEYNFALLENGLGLNNQEIGRQSLKLSSSKSFDLAKWQLQRQKYFIVHPGMSGSALNWPIKNYIQAIDQILLKQFVVITGTLSDQPFLEEIKANFAHHPRVKFLDSQLSGDELIFVLENSTAVLAPSTGVLHLAASTGVPTFGIYSPVRVQKPERWGPHGAHTKVFVPQVQCPGEMNCLREACNKFNCMELISTTEIVEALLNI